MGLAFARGLESRGTDETQRAKKSFFNGEKNLMCVRLD